MFLYHSTTGSGSPTLVLTHGLASSSDTWKPHIPLLERRFRVITWDLRGHGRSHPAPQSCRLGDLADDLRSVLDATRTDRAVLVGHSAGGVISMAFALRHPERVSGLVLVSTSSECNERAERFYERMADEAETEGMAPVRRKLGVPVDGPYAPPADPATVAAITRSMAGMRRDPLTPRLGTIRRPSLILVGDRDFLGVGGSVIMYRRLPSSRLAILAGRGHGLLLEDPGDFARRVTQFASPLVG